MQLPVNGIASQIRQQLSEMGLPTQDLNELPTSTKRFADGAAYRVEIPSTEGPQCLTAVLTEAERRGVLIHRISQGSGVLMMTDEELDETARLAAEASVEMSLFLRPNAGWGASVASRATAGGSLAAAAHGQSQLVQCLSDAVRAADHGFRSVLVADIGVLFAFTAMKKAGGLPPDMQAKISVALPVANAPAARVVEDLGASTINVPTDLSLAQIAAIRAAVDCPLDVYVEAPDNLGGIVRLHEIAEIVRVAAPVHLKYGLRNAPDVYPAGGHLDVVTVALSRERVRRAYIGQEILHREGLADATSERGAAGLAVPQLPVVADAQRVGSHQWN